MLSAVHCTVTVFGMRFQVLCISGASILWPPIEILNELNNQEYAMGTKELRFTGLLNFRQNVVTHQVVCFLLPLLLQVLLNRQY